MEIFLTSKIAPVEPFEDFKAYYLGYCCETSGQVPLRLEPNYDISRKSPNRVKVFEVLSNHKIRNYEEEVTVRNPEYEGQRFVVHIDNEEVRLKEIQSYKNELAQIEGIMTKHRKEKHLCPVMLFALNNYKNDLLSQVSCVNLKTTKACEDQPEAKLFVHDGSCDDPESVLGIMNELTCESDLSDLPIAIAQFDDDGIEPLFFDRS